MCSVFSRKVEVSLFLSSMYHPIWSNDSDGKHGSLGPQQVIAKVQGESRLVKYHNLGRIILYNLLLDSVRRRPISTGWEPAKMPANPKCWVGYTAVFLCFDGLKETKLGGGNSNIFYFHPENWGRWTPFWRSCFSDGLVQPPSRSKDVESFSSVRYRHLPVLWSSREAWDGILDGWRRK